MRNRRSQQLPVKVFRGIEHVETIQRQIYTDSNGDTYCSYRGTRHTVTKFQHADDQGGIRNEYHIAID